MFILDKIINSFEIIASNKANEILLKNMNNCGEKNTLYVFAGPNGSGKSTLISNIYKQNQLKNVKYINADIFAKTLFNNLKDEKEKNYKAMFYTMEKIENNIKSGDSVIYETVLSHPSKLEIIKKYKDNGFIIFSVFISPEKPEINIARVEKRVREGGHNVDKEKIKGRFYRSNNLKTDLMKLSDIFYEIDNSNLPKIVKSFNQKNIKISSKE